MPNDTMPAPVAGEAPPLLALSGVGRSHPLSGGAAPVHALSDVCLRVMAGERVAILGPSGSGKSSLLNLLGLLDRPTQGWCRLDGEDVSALDSRARARLRNQKIGFVFQNFQLLPQLTAIDNVALPLHYAGVPRRQVRPMALQALAAVGLALRQGHRPGQLSGGERQRVAIARAIVRMPRLLLADEPTGALDAQNGRLVLDLVEDLNRRHGIAVLMVTHDAAIAARFPRCVHMRDGRVEADVRGPADAAPSRA